MQKFYDRIAMDNLKHMDEILKLRKEMDLLGENRSNVMQEFSELQYIETEQKINDMVHEDLEMLDEDNPLEPNQSSEQINIKEEHELCEVELQKDNYFSEEEFQEDHLNEVAANESSDEEMLCSTNADLDNEHDMEIKTENLEVEILQVNTSSRKSSLKSKRKVNKDSTKNQDENNTNAEDKTNAADTEIFQCSECSRTFRLIQHYRLHMRKTHSKSPNLKVRCKHPNCEKVFNTPYLMEKHQKVHLPMYQKKTVPCPYCDKKFTSQISVQTHIKFTHMDVRPFICEECGVAVRTNASLKEHMLIHTDYAP